MRETVINFYDIHFTPSVDTPKYRPLQRAHKDERTATPRLRAARVGFRAVLGALLNHQQHNLKRI